MRTINVQEITNHIKEMCIEANHFLSEDMKCAMSHAVQTEKAPLGKQILEQLQAAVRDGNIITGTSAGCAIPFGLALVAALKGEQIADKIKNQIVIR